MVGHSDSVLSEYLVLQNESLYSALLLGTMFLQA